MRVEVDKYDLELLRRKPDLMSFALEIARAKGDKLSVIRRYRKKDMIEYIIENLRFLPVEKVSELQRLIEERKSAKATEN